MKGLVHGLQDDHILARKYADRWMGKALGVGLFKRRLYRKEVEDTRQVLYTTINPLAKVGHALAVWAGNKVQNNNFILSGFLAAYPPVSVLESTFPHCLSSHSVVLHMSTQEHTHNLQVAVTGCSYTFMEQHSAEFHSLC